MAEEFEARARKPDPKMPGVRIDLFRGESAAPLDEAGAAPKRPAPGNPKAKAARRPRT